MKIEEFKKTAGKCAECRTFDLLHHDEQHGWAYPLFDEYSLCPSGIVIVSEAPNFDDTFNESKRRLTYDIQTDDTGNFTRELLESVGLKVSDVLFTNSVLCLPARDKDGKYKVSAKQLKKCSKWLSMAIACCSAKIVITLGGEALKAVKLISSHRLELKNDVAKIQRWNNRYLFPLYHPSKLGRVTRSREKQLADIQALKKYCNTEKFVGHDTEFFESSVTLRDDKISELGAPMKELNKIKDILNKHRDELREKYKITEIGIFGSYIRGEQKKESDIDVLVEFSEPISLIDLIGAENYISDLIGRKVDLVPREDIRPELKQVILDEVVYI